LSSINYALYSTKPSIPLRPPLYTLVPCNYALGNTNSRCIQGYYEVVYAGILGGTHIPTHTYRTMT